MVLILSVAILLFSRWNDRGLTPPNQANTLGVYQGYGIGIQTADISSPGAFDDLDPRFVRMELGPDWNAIPEKIPSGKTVAEYLSFIKKNYNADYPNRTEEAQKAFRFLKERNTQIILTVFDLPGQWLAKERGSKLFPLHVEDLARFHTAHLLHLRSLGVEIDYIELANEPDGWWCGQISPSDYARLLVRSYDSFQDHHLSHLKILGPGLTQVYLEGDTERYLDAIEEVGHEYLAGWSTHAWDEGICENARPEYLYNRWKPFRKFTKKIEPEKQKPIFVTEYGCKVTQIGDRRWRSPMIHKTDTFVDTWEYAVRVIAHSISHLNNGANALILYRLSDPYWTETGWGFTAPLEDGRFKKKPIYEVVRQALKALPVGGVILAPSWYVDDEPITLSIIHQEKDGAYHILATNFTEQQERKVISLSKKMGSLNLVRESLLTEAGLANQSGIEIASDELILTLPAKSVARFILATN